MRKHKGTHRRTSAVRRMLWDRTQSTFATTAGSGNPAGIILFDPLLFTVLPVDKTTLWGGCFLNISVRMVTTVTVANSTPTVFFGILVRDTNAPVPDPGFSLAGDNSQDWLDLWQVQMNAGIAGVLEHDPLGANGYERLSRRVKSRRILDQTQTITLCMTVKYLNAAPIDTLFSAQCQFVVSNLTRGRELQP